MEFKSLFDYLAIICTLRHPTWINAPSNKIANILSKAFYFHYNQRQPSLEERADGTGLHSLIAAEFTRQASKQHHFVALSRSIVLCLSRCISRMQFSYSRCISYMRSVSSCEVCANEKEEDINSDSEIIHWSG